MNDAQLECLSARFPPAKARQFCWRKEYWLKVSLRLSLIDVGREASPSGNILSRAAVGNLARSSL